MQVSPSQIKRHLTFLWISHYIRVICGVHHYLIGFLWYITAARCLRKVYLFTLKCTPAIVRMCSSWILCIIFWCHKIFCVYNFVWSGGRGFMHCCVVELVLAHIFLKKRICVIITDCPYGDRFTGCSSIQARQCYINTNAELCCGSCAEFATGTPGKSTVN